MKTFLFIAESLNEDSDNILLVSKFLTGDSDKINLAFIH